MFTGGGSGGHIFPVLSVMKELSKIFSKEELEMYYVGPKEEIVEKYIKTEDVKVRYIFAGKLRRYFQFMAVIRNIVDIFFKIPVGIMQSFLLIFITSPDLIISKGGYGSLPVVIAGKIFQVPIFIHESDKAPGKTNKFLQKFALEVFVSFPETEDINPQKMIIVGNPIMEDVTGGDREEAKKMFSITSEKPILFIIGGSLGSERINDLVLSIITDLLNHFEVIHQCGKNNIESVSAESGAVIFDKELKKYYHLYPFLDQNQMKNAYALADLVISRAGSGSIFEIAANQKPSVLLPLSESAQNHQVKNAYFYAKRGAAVVMEEQNLTSHFFLARIKRLFSSPEQMRTMAIRAGEFAKPRSAKIIAEYIKEYLTR